MSLRGRVRGGWSGMAGCLAAVCLCAGMAGAASTPSLARPRSAWDQALAARQAFEQSSPHTRTSYTRVMDAFRAIYHDNPAAAHAPDAIFQVAGLLEEQGRELGDRRSFEAAIGQYEFLRKEYPQSRLRAEALLAEGTIEAQDLDDAKQARVTYAAVLHEAPHSETAREARAALAAAAPTHLHEAATHGAQSRLDARTGDTRPADTIEADTPVVAQAMPVHSAPGALHATGASASATHAESLAQVTGIRHWSTPTYTRVAIDLGNEVKFEAARVPHPDRIYFDLHGAHLSPELIGKSFDVTDDGFLKRIRAAQASGDVTRVVLDVNDVTEYSAFLLPNPYRLIIDIHGRKGDAHPLATEPPATVSTPGEGLTEVPVAPAAVRTASVAANRSGLPPMAVTDGGAVLRPSPGVSLSSPATDQPNEPRDRTNRDQTAVIRGHPAPDATPAPRTGLTARSTPARPVPNTVAVKAPATSTEVAAVSTAPGRVDATYAPTSRPIAAVVKKKSGKANSTAATTLPDPDTGSDMDRSPATSLRTLSGRTIAATPARAAEKTADGETSLVRALGLKIGRIVIDAGHGGHDSGTLGVDGIQEKDVVLDVALRLGKLLHDRLGAEIIYTRSDDTYIPLETRTAIANKAQADLFLSIHANSSPDPSARGVEVYYLNFTSDPTALDVAARENAVGGQGVHQLSDLVKKIALKDKIAESREFAADVDASLFAGITRGNEGLRNRGVKKAPFVVLIGANMPSILAEISFVTNARDAEQLREPDYRERVAESIYNGVAKYESGLAAARPAPVQRAAVQGKQSLNPRN